MSVLASTVANLSSEITVLQARVTSISSAADTNATLLRSVVFNLTTVQQLTGANGALPSAISSIASVLNTLNASTIQPALASMQSQIIQTNSTCVTSQVVSALALIEIAQAINTVNISIQAQNSVRECLSRLLPSTFCCITLKPRTNTSTHPTG
jgi:hypothetical protein